MALDSFIRRSNLDKNSFEEMALNTSLSQKNIDKTWFEKKMALDNFIRETLTKHHLKIWLWKFLYVWVSLTKHWRFTVHPKLLWIHLYRIIPFTKYEYVFYRCPKWSRKRYQGPQTYGFRWFWTGFFIEVYQSTNFLTLQFKIVYKLCQIKIYLLFSKYFNVLSESS